MPDTVSVSPYYIVNGPGGLSWKVYKGVQLLACFYSYLHAQQYLEFLKDEHSPE